MQSTKILTDESMMELVSHGFADFPFQYYYEDVGKFDNRCIDWHWHREFELVSVTEGIVHCSIGNIHYILEPGDGVFINSGAMHRFLSTGTAIIPNVLFAPEFIAREGSSIYEKFMAPFLFSGISHFVLRTRNPWQSHLLSILSDLYKLCEDQTATWELGAHALVCQIWCVLFEHKDEFATMEHAGVNRLSQARFKRMTHFIEQNYEKRLTLGDIAHSAGVSKREALRCFQCSIPLSPIEYLNKYRLNQAKILLLHTDRSITDIAERSGFESTSYFDRLYKREYHMTPGRHRLAFQHADAKKGRTQKKEHEIQQNQEETDFTCHPVSD
nr:AraC family transcriptional regulator [uncultured Clostridium sp.]